jgi:hypothetical protein
MKTTDHLIRRVFIGLVLVVVSPAFGQQRPAAKPAPAKQLAGLAAARTLMAGAALSVQWHGQRPDGETAFAIARPEATPGIFIEGTLASYRGASVTLTVPGLEGHYELRLLQRDPAGLVIIVARQPLAATLPSATIAGPVSVRRGQSFPARGNGPNGDRDLVTLVDIAAAADASGPVFLPADSIEGLLEAPSKAGVYELRYVMVAPLTGAVVLARQPVKVE